MPGYAGPVEHIDARLEASGITTWGLDAGDRNKKIINLLIIFLYIFFLSFLKFSLFDSYILYLFLLKLLHNRFDVVIWFDCRYEPRTNIEFRIWRSST